MEFKNQELTDNNEHTDVDRINKILDHLFIKLYCSPQLIISCCRAALEQGGIVVPTLEVEDGPGSHPFPYEALFKITNDDPSPVGDEDEGEDEYMHEPWKDDKLYFYLCIDRVGIHFEAYAQIINREELEDIRNMDSFEDSSPIEEFPSHYRKQVRHSSDD